MSASKAFLLAATLVATIVTFVPAASAVGICERPTICVQAETYSPPISFQYCLSYEASSGGVGHAGTACTQEPLCTNPWVCLQRLPHIKAEDASDLGA